jgi:hypothetical protein
MRDWKFGFQLLSSNFQFLIIILFTIYDGNLVMYDSTPGRISHQDCHF